jgi:hypothetical protein
MPGGEKRIEPVWGAPKIVEYASTVQLEPSQSCS